MSDAPSELFTAFVSQLSVAPSAAEAALLAARLDERFGAAQRMWTPIALGPARFGRFLAERLRPGLAPAAALESLSLEELFLTCACADGNQMALRQLEARYFPVVRAALLRMRLSSDAIEELLQRQRIALFVGDDGAARIASFAGRGGLGSWLAVSAVRAAYKLVQRETREVATEDERLLDLPSGERPPEAALTRRDYGDTVRRALKDALTRLSDREKNLLRQHYLDGLSHEQMARLYRIHRGTVASWLASARQRLLDQTRQLIMQETRAPLSECNSMLRAMMSRFDLTLHRLLQPQR